MTTLDVKSSVCTAADANHTLCSDSITFADVKTENNSK